MLTWNDVGERIFESGVNRGVLYPENGPGVVWNGLISANVGADGGLPRTVYMDGVPVRKDGMPADFKGRIEAFTYPLEFERADGTWLHESGIAADGQVPESFGLSYRTRIGNDTLGGNFGYKTHLIYNAVVPPTDKAYTTVGETLEPSTFSWDIEATPVAIPGFRPTAHLTFDSRHVSNFAMMVLERILYGYYEDPRLPLPSELATLPLTQRQIIVVGYPDKRLLPSFAKEGDTVFSQSDHGVYSLGSQNPSVRPVFVLANADPDLLPDTAYPGDIVYVDSTGMLYKVGE